MPDLVLGIDARKGKRGAGEFNKSLNSINRTAKVLTGVLVSLGAVLSFREFSQLSDAFTQVNNRLRLVTKSSREFSAVQARLIQQSKDNFLALESQAEVFQRVAKGAGEAGLSTELALQATEAVAAAIRLSGVSAEAARNAVVQFGQGLAAGAIRGDELRSVLEQTPALAQAIADALGTTVGQLRAFGAAGLITTKKIIPGLAKQLDVLRERAALLAPTFSQAFENLRTDTVVAIGDFNDLSGTAGEFTRTIADLGDFISENLPEALGTVANEFGILFKFGKEVVTGLSTGFDLFADAILDVIPAVEGLGDTLLTLIADTLPNLRALINLFSTEVVTSFAMAETEAKGFFKETLIGFRNIRLANQILGAQRMGQVEVERALRVEFGKNLEELARLAKARVDEGQRELDFRLANIKAILEERTANLDARNAIIAKARALRESRAAALADLEATRGRAGGFAEGDQAGGIAKITKEIQKLLDKTRGPFGDFIADFTEFQTVLAADFPDNFRVGVRELIEDLAGSTATLAQFEAALRLGESTGLRAESIDFLKEFSLSFDEFTGRLIDFREAVPTATVDEFITALRLARDTTLEQDTAQNQLNEALEDYLELLNAGLISQETFNAKQKELEENLLGLTDVFKTFSEEAAKGIQNAFSDFLFDPFEDGLKGMARGFIDTMRRIASEILANAILKSLFTSLAKGSGPVGGFATAALGAIGGREHGGGVRAGQTVVVGEREPELFRPRQGGTILNGAQMAGLMPTIQNNIILDPRGLTQALSSPQGSRDLVNAITINKRAIAAALR